MKSVGSNLKIKYKISIYGNLSNITKYISSILIMLQSSFEHINIINFKRCKVMKHEENVDVRRVSRIAKIDTHNKLIQLNKSNDIGIKIWGRIDYLCNILGYRMIKSGIVVIDSFSDGEVKAHNREVKKQIKADKANNNMKKNTKKKK